MRAEKQPNKTYSLWDVATSMVVSPQVSASKKGHHRAGLPRFRLGTKLIVALGFVVLGAAALADQQALHGVSGGQVFAIRFALLFTGLAMTLGGAVALLNDPVYHALTSLGRRIAALVWALFALASFALAAVATLGSVYTLLLIGTGAPPDSRITVALIGLALCSIGTLILPTLIGSPLLSTAKAPRLYQAPVAQNLWAFSLSAFVTTLSCGSVTIIVLNASREGPSVDLIVLVVSIAIGLLGAIFGWHRRTLERLEAYRMRLLSVLSNTLSVLDPESKNDSEVKPALRELLRNISLSPFRPHSLATLPDAASFEIVEVTRLIEWAFNDDDDHKLPRSISARARPERIYEELFSSVVQLGKPEIRNQSREFILKLYERLAWDTKDTSSVSCDKR